MNPIDKTSGDFNRNLDFSIKGNDRVTKFSTLLIFSGRLKLIGPSVVEKNYNQLKGIKEYSQTVAKMLNLFLPKKIFAEKIIIVNINDETHYLSRNSLRMWLQTANAMPNRKTGKIASSVFNVENTTQSQEFLGLKQLLITNTAKIDSDRVSLDSNIASLKTLINDSKKLFDDPIGHKKIAIEELKQKLSVTVGRYDQATIASRIQRLEAMSEFRYNMYATFLLELKHNFPNRELYRDEPSQSMEIAAKKNDFQQLRAEFNGLLTENSKKVLAKLSDDELINEAKTIFLDQTRFGAMNITPETVQDMSVIEVYHNLKTFYVENYNSIKDIKVLLNALNERFQLNQPNLE